MMEPTTQLCKRWDENKLRVLLSPADVAIVRKMYIPQSPCNDEWIWHYTKDGSYSVKSGYWLSTHLPDQDSPTVQPPAGNPTMKARVWKTTIPPKLKHFLWRVLSRALGTTTELCRREYQLIQRVSVAAQLPKL
ncbi:hypothetical protein V5N11_006243 [Cardamine amara subsp. amara]|uniref:Reverse transcriptase zinc-binding domain-containing protein n=1 Tax=Cardamine amara subsp. amara TaxID=228776 RepID=A0ABD1A4H6_CARAN